MVQLKVSPSGSLIGILQVIFRRLFVEPFIGIGVPKVGGRFPGPFLLNV
jgi:hypothetical protein